MYFKQFGGLFLGEYLAGDESSKLFTEVRKKLGAAYAIDATNYVNNSLFLISTGISKEKIAVASKAIKNGVKAVQEGKVDKDVFNKAKAALKRNYQISADRQDLIFNSNAGKCFKRSRLYFLYNELMMLSNLK